MQAAAVATTPAATAKRFRRDIEGLRAVAIIGVLAFHLGVPGFSGGFVGVDVFFVISGYLITGLLMQELESNGRIDLLRFYGRRVRRLLPAALAMTLVTLAVIVFILSPEEQRRFARTAEAVSLYVSNFWFLGQSTNYFAPRSAANPFLHTWTLGVEEQFYLLWPAFLLLVSGRRLRARRLAIGMAVITAGAFAVEIWFTGRSWPVAFYASPARAWEFGLGGLAAFAGAARWAERSKLTRLVEWSGALAIVLSFVLMNEQSAFPGVIALLPVMGTVGLLVSGTRGRERGPVWLLHKEPFQWVGRHSYSIYLWHWPIVILAGALYPSLSVNARIICTALCLLIAAASYRWLENPIRHNPWLAVRTRRSILLGASLTAFGCMAAFGVQRMAKHFAATPAQRAVSVFARQFPVAKERCMAGLTESNPLVCAFGPGSSATTVVLFGDSHAAEWATPMAAVARSENWHMITYLKGGCSAADVPVYSPELHRSYRECAAWRKAAVASIVRVKPKLIVIGEFASEYITGRRPLSESGDARLTRWIDGLKQTITELQPSGASVMLMSDTPTPNRDIPVCVERALWRGTRPNCDLPRSLALHPEVTSAERQLVRQLSSVRYVDLTSEFCGPETCPVLRDDLLMYKDDSHVTRRYAATLAEPLKAAIVSNFPELGR